MTTYPHDGCAFCEYIAGTRPCVVVRRTEHFLAFVNLRQYEKGALLVIPTQHAATIVELPLDVVALIHREAAALGRTLMRACKATGVNIFQNNGLDAGQHVPHFHVHVVPRYPGSDPTKIFMQANFEPVSLAEQEAVAIAVKRNLEEKSPSRYAHSVGPAVHRESVPAAGIRIAAAE